MDQLRLLKSVSNVLRIFLLVRGSRYWRHCQSESGAADSTILHLNSCKYFLGRSSYFDEYGLCFFSRIDCHLEQKNAGQAQVTADRKKKPR